MSNKKGTLSLWKAGNRVFLSALSSFFLLNNILEISCCQRYIFESNYGAAVDLTIIDSSGEELDMGTSFDCFDLKAQPRYETLFTDTALIAGVALDPAIKNRIRADIERSGLLSSISLENRKLLREVMLEAGFIAIPFEWWHFNAFNKDEVRKRFSIVE